MKWYSVGICAPVGVASAALARSVRAQASEHCSRGHTQLVLSECAADEFHNADHAMRQAYRATLVRLQHSEQTGLLSAQRAWLRFGGAECAYVAMQYEGGSMQPSSVWPASQR